MASVANDPNGRRRIQFVDTDGKRKAIRAGKMSLRDAESIARHVEALLVAKKTGQPIASSTASWLATIADELHGKLAAVGLIEPRQAKPTATLGPFVTEYIDGRVDLKQSTKIVRGVVKGDLTTYFGESRDVRTITPGDADNFKQWLIGRKLAPTTIHKRLQVARSFFHAMRRRKLVDENPFDGVNAVATGIKDRQRFVTREETARVLAACPDHHWRTIVALARYGGLRCPSEVLSLRWQDVDWEAGRIVVTSPKTEHHAGKASRIAPLFVELQPHLAEAFDLAPEGAVYVVDERFRKGAMGPNGWLNANLRTTFGKIIRRAGLEAWPRLFHNLRASRETELVEAYPIQVVTSWLGNTPRVAMQHYLMTTNEHFDAAVQGTREAAQNQAQWVRAAKRRETQGENPENEKRRENTPFPAFSHSEQTYPVERAAPCSSETIAVAPKYELSRCA